MRRSSEAPRSDGSTAQRSHNPIVNVFSEQKYLEILAKKTRIYGIAQGSSFNPVS